MPDRFNRPTEPAHALYHDVLCGNISAVQQAITATPELIKGQGVVDGAWSHGGRRCGAQDDVIECLQLLADHGADFSKLGPGTYDSAFKAFPRAAALLFELGANPNATDGEGRTGLHYMAAIGNRFACEVLLKHGASISTKDANGETALDVATRNNVPRLVDFLRTHGADSVSNNSSDGRCNGEVTWYRADRGYGYIRNEVYELFFDRECVVGTEPTEVEEGTLLSFEVTHDKFGLRAANVEFLSNQT